MSEFLECIEAGGHVCGIADVGTFLGIVPLQVAEGGVFFLGSSHEVSESLKDVGVWIGCSFLVWNGKREANAQVFNVSGTMFLVVFLGFWALPFLAAVRKGKGGLLMSVRLVLGGDLGWWAFEGGGACANDVWCRIKALSMMLGGIWILDLGFTTSVAMAAGVVVTVLPALLV